MSLINMVKRASFGIAVVLIISGCGRSHSVDDYIAAAKISIEEGNNSAAIINLKNVLKLDAKNSEARLILGKAYFKEGMWLLAEKEFSKALEFGVDKNNVLPLLAQVYFHLNNSDSINELININSSLDISVYIILRTYLGLSYVHDGNAKIAKVTFEEIIADKVDSPYTKVSQSWLSALSGDYKGGLKLLDEINSANSILDIVVISRAQFLFAKNDMSEAAGAYNSFLESHPKDLYSRLMLASSLTRDEKYPKAEEHVDVILENIPSQPISNELKSQIRFADKDYAQAKHFAELALQRVDTLIISRIVAGISAYQLEEKELAYTHLVTLKDKLPLNHPAQLLLNKLRLELGYIDENIAALSTAPAEESDVKMLSISAQKLFDLGRVKSAEKLLSKAASISPKNGLIDFQIGMQKLLRNDESAAEFFEAAYNKNPNEDTIAAMQVLKLLNDKKYEQATSITKDIEKRNKELSYGLMATIYKSQGKYSLAEAQLKKVLALNKHQLGALYSLADLAKKNNNNEAEIGFYRKILSIDPEQIYAINGLLKYANDVLYHVNIKAFFESNIIKHDGTAVTSLALAEYFIFQKKFNDAQNILISALDKTPSDLRLNLLLAKTYMFHKDYESASKQLDRYIIIDENEPKAHLAKALIFNEIGDEVNALKSQQQAAKLQPNNPAIQADLAALYLDNNKLLETKKILLQLVSTPSIELKLLRLKGKVAFIEKDYQKAIQFLEPIMKKVNSQEITLEVAQSMQNLGQEDNALRVINDAINRTSVDVPIAILLKQAELYSIQNKLKKATIVYKQLLKRTNNHYVILNNLAWVQLKKGEAELALKNAELAISKAGSDPIVQNTLGVTLLASGKNLQALLYLKKSYESNQTNSNYAIHYIQALIANTDFTPAKKILTEVDESLLSEDSLKRLSLIKEKI